ncbi:troponin I type 2a (skeletal, fast), tandem duplicate 1 [Gadus macrocephalus]|uniref:troponin I type 2a (skeletal, fast), tandem duplicate 1 n=1 Tax=Gadus macrocephalus TaxID=80720 RepID=UPI0028CB696B|nr:troponin I type 2a (skeletal, fast), tandem duplicate 1 [Gadus macrocephalus]
MELPGGQGGHKYVAEVVPPALLQPHRRATPPDAQIHTRGTVNVAKMSEKKMSSSRKHHLKSLMLAIGKDLLEQEEKEQEEERERYMEEHCPAPILPRTMQELQEMCRGVHHNIEEIDEERYDLEMKVNKCNKEIEDLNIKVQDLKGKFKKPVLRKVRMSADAMLKALLGSKHTVNMDLRANLKQVKKEVKEEDKDLRDVGDWRKNIEDKSGMDGRKKMFEAEA